MHMPNVVIHYLVVMVVLWMLYKVTLHLLYSSDELERGDTSPYAVALSPFDAHNLKELSILELEQATGHFSQNNIIGEGRFGLAYRGLLQDGSIVAIKRRLHAPTRFFFHQVNLRELSRV